MLDIDKESLTSSFIERDWRSLYNSAYKISEFILNKEFKIFSPEIVEDMKQECVENLHKKILMGKVDPTKNIFSFIWKNSKFRILEILRKETNRRRIANFVPFDLVDFEVNEHDEITRKYYDESFE